VSSGAEFDVVRHPRARRMKLAFDPASGRVRLVLPRRARLADAVAWAKGHSAWIAEQRAKLPPAHPFEPGAVVPVGGEPLTLEWRGDARRTPFRDGDRLVAGGPVDAFAARVTRWLRREALAVLTEETGHYAARAGVRVERVGVGDTSSRWGSCSSTGTIRYSWRLILAPAAVRRATVAHEVAHRRHMDHSSAFHALVAEIYEGDATAARRWLKANGASLHWYGRPVS
jgi:predicted metal-dependent hydrolase